MAKPALNQNLYNYTYLTANGYLNKFRTALERPDLDRALLTKLLQTFNHDYKLVRFIVPDTKGNMALYYKDTLNNILGIDRTGFQVTKPKSNPYLNILKNYLDKWDYEDYAKEDYQTDNDNYIDMPDADMETVSRNLINYQNVNESSFKNLLSENEGGNMKRARKYLESKGYQPEQRQEILDSIRTDIPNSRLQQCKFLLGVTRLYMENQLSDGRSIAELNKVLKYIASDAHVNEYDFNLNGENLDTLVQRFSGVAKTDLEQSKTASNARQLTVNNNYTIVPIDSPKEASKYGKYTSWCVTHSEEMYNSYTANGAGRFYFCLKRGFESEPQVAGENCPLDKYGLSMIAVSVTMEGELNTVTCRWNHDNGGNDNIMTLEQLEDLLGRNFYQTFKPYSREELHSKGIILFDEVQGLLDQGIAPEKVFNGEVIFIYGFAKVELNGKYNYITKESKLLSNQWFDWADYFEDGFARVYINRKYNYITKEGKLLSNQWFDFADDFEDGFARVELNGKYNYITKESKLLSNQWFNWVDYFRDGFAQVRLNGKWNFITEEGKLLSNQWFDGVGVFKDGFAMVKLNGELRKIGTNGNIVAESKKTMGKRIIITESQYERLIQEGGEKKYAVEPNKVKIVVKFLDDNFLKAGIPTLGEDGYPKTVPIVVLKGTDGQPVKKMTDAQLYELLKDKFGKIYSDANKVNKFLKQIIKDWYYGKISKEGLLTVNLY